MKPCFQIVIPCRNEAERLPPFLEALACELAKSDLPATIQIVDDGSRPENLDTLSQAIAPIVSSHANVSPVHAYQPNRGKGFAIRTGWDLAPQATHLAFVDADGAIPAKEACRLLEAVALEPQARQLVFASRYAVPRSEVKRSRRRDIASRIFRLLLKVRYHPEILDTQCGFKIVPQAFYQEAKADFHQDRYGFDLELYVQARSLGYDIRELPISWQEVAGSNLNGRHALGLAISILFKRI